MKKFLIEHKFILIYFIFLIIIAFIVNFLIQGNTIFLTGEFLFSFDYLQHIKNILTDFFYNNEIMSVNSCQTCINFYHYSRWWALFTLGYISIGQILYLNPLVFFILSNFLLQTLALYIFVRVFFPNFDKIAFLIGSLGFVIFPFKFLYISSGSLYYFHYSLIIIFLSVTYFLLKNSSSLSMKKFVGLSVLTGFIGSFFFNISIGYLPIFIYIFIAFILFFQKIIFKNSKKFTIFSLIGGSIVLIINIPILLSIYLNGNSRIFDDYMKFSLIESLTSRFTGYIGNYYNTVLPVDGEYVLLYFGLLLIFLVIANISKRLKIYGIVIYFVTAIILTGGVVYSYLFHYFPLMESIRATHRFLFLQQVVIFSIIYFGLNYFKELHISLFKKILLYMVCTIILVGVPASFIYNNISYVHKVSIPNDYSNLYTYLKNNNDKKVYFPYYMDVNKSILGSYTWTKDQKSLSLYTNPFTSIYPLNNILNSENYEKDIQKMESVYMIDLSLNNTGEIIKYLELKGVKYLIVDKNYLWQDNFSGFDLNSFTHNLNLEKQFGNLYLYSLEDKSKECKQSYGAFSLGYCHVKDDTIPQYLVDISMGDYLTERYFLHNQKNIKSLKADGILIYNYFTKPDQYKYFYQNKIDTRFYYDIVNLSGGDNVFFDKNLTTGKYDLLVPIMKAVTESNLFGNSKLKVLVDDKIVNEISPYDLNLGNQYEKINLDLEKNSNIKLIISGTGNIIMRQPFVFSSKDYENIVSQSLDIKSFTTDMNRIKQDMKNTDITVNNILVGDNYKNIDNLNRYGLIQLNLLEDKYIDKMGFSGFNKTISNEKINYDITHQGTYNINYHLTSSGINKISLDIGTYFLSPNRILSIKVFDEKGDVVKEELNITDDNDKRLKGFSWTLSGSGEKYYNIRIVLQDNDGDYAGAGFNNILLKGIVE